MKGGTEVDQTAVEGAVRTFRDLLRPDLEICVPTIRIISDLAGTKVGRYNTVSHGVRIEGTTEHVIYHELCHAVQRQNHLPVSSPNWEISPQYVEDLLEGDNPASPRHEAFAMTCEDALDVAFLLGPRCDDDAPGIDAYNEVRDLFTGPDDTVVLDREGVFHPSVTVPTEGVTFDLQLTDDGIRLEIDEQVLFLDPWSGADVPEADAAPLEFPDGPGTELGALWLREITAPNGAVARRRMYIQGDQRILSLGCVHPGEVAFVFDDWLWSAWLEDGAVQLGWWYLP